VALVEASITLLILYNEAALNLEGDYGKSRERASAASCGAGSSAVAVGEIRSSNFGHRVVKRFGNIPKHKPTQADHIGSFAAENGAGTEGKMGKGAEWIAAGSRENNFLGSWEANHVGFSPQEDFSRAASAVGEDTGREEDSGLDQKSLLRVCGRLQCFGSTLQSGTSSHRPPYKNGRDIASRSGCSFIHLVEAGLAE